MSRIVLEAGYVFTPYVRVNIFDGIEDIPYNMKYYLNPYSSGDILTIDNEDVRIASLSTGVPTDDSE